MIFPEGDTYWMAVADFLRATFGDHATFLAPNEFHELFPRAYPYDMSRHIDVRGLDAVVVHKGMLGEVGRDVCQLLLDQGIPLFGNEVFAVFALKEAPPRKLWGAEHFADFRIRAREAGAFKPNPAPAHSEFNGPATVILMTTYNRPERLAHALETVLPLGAPILVVNDGSAPEHAEAYAEIVRQTGVRSLNLPDNRGLASALNMGLSYWLADPNVEWICYLQDDVEVRPDLLAALARVQDRQDYPLLAGRADPLHKVYGERMVNGCRVLLQRMSPGIHLHAHRDYWKSMLPIPSPYFQAPRRRPGWPARGADEDWWISQWSPHSIVKQGKYVAVLPGLVRTTTTLPSESTWGNAGGEIDPPLPPPEFTAEGFVPVVMRGSGF
jgi:hypothetical protein